MKKSAIERKLKVLKQLKSSLEDLEDIIQNIELDKYDILLMKLASAVNLDYNVLRSSSRKRKVAYTRSVIIKILFDEMGLRCHQIAVKLNKDHSTILASYRKYDLFYKNYEDYRSIANQILKKLKEYEATEII